MTQRRKLEWALHQPNLWASLKMNLVAVCGSPEVPQHLLWDQKLDSHPTPYNIIADFDFLKYWSWKSLMNKLGNRKLNTKKLFKSYKMISRPLFFSLYIFSNSKLSKQPILKRTFIIPLLPVPPLLHMHWNKEVLIEKLIVAGLGCKNADWLQMETRLMDHQMLLFKWEWGKDFL